MRGDIFIFIWGVTEQCCNWANSKVPTAFSFDYQNPHGSLITWIHLKFVLPFIHTKISKCNAVILLIHEIKQQTLGGWLSCLLASLAVSETSVIGHWQSKIKVDPFCNRAWQGSWVGYPRMFAMALGAAVSGNALYFYETLPKGTIRKAKV